MRDIPEGALPRSVLEMMATAEYFNLSGNSFTNVQEGTALYDMVHRMTNWGKREVIQWSKTNGGGEFTTIPDEMFVFKNLVQLDLSYNPGLTGEKNCSTHATSGENSMFCRPA